jgi:hypothetical protein
MELKNNFFLFTMYSHNQLTTKRDQDYFLTEDQPFIYFANIFLIIIEFYGRSFLFFMLEFLLIAIAV